MSAEDSIGTIVGTRAGCVVVHLSSGEEVLCRGATRIHRPLGFFAIPIGRRVRIRQTSARKRPLIVEIFEEEQ